MAKGYSRSLATVGLVALIIALCSLIVLYLIRSDTPVPETNDSGVETGGPAQAEGSLQIAVDACIREARSELRNLLQGSYLEPLNTRYLASTKEYLVFLAVQLRGYERVAYYYQCTVSAETKQVIDSQLNSPPGVRKPSELP